MQLIEQHCWEYRSREETWSVVFTDDSVILQSAVNAVLTESEHDGFGVVHRIGLPGTSTSSAQVPAGTSGSTCGQASMEYRTRSPSPDDTSCTSRARPRRWLLIPAHADQ